MGVAKSEGKGTLFQVQRWQKTSSIKASPNKKNGSLNYNKREKYKFELDIEFFKYKNAFLRIFHMGSSYVFEIH